MQANACIISDTAVSDWARDAANWRAHTGSTPEQSLISVCAACSAAAFSEFGGMQNRKVFCCMVAPKSASVEPLLRI
jgi:hypothetical protein